jgi:branched-chain amino acid aminotransferase
MSFQATVLSPAGLEPYPYPVASLAEAASHEPEGVYTITRTFKTDHALLLNSHLDRLEESADLEGISVQLNRGALRDALRTLIQRSGNAESRFRFSVPRENPDHIYLTVEALKPVPAEVRQNGVKVATLQASRHNPAAKTTRWMSIREQAKAGLPSDIYEAILVDDSGHLLEGTSSNFYAVKENKLYTAGEGVLGGISRRTVFESLDSLLPLVLEAVTLSEVPQLQEAFLTSSGRGVIPIVEIEGQKIGPGVPGPFTQEISRRYDAWTEAHLEAI